MSGPQGATPVVLFPDVIFPVDSRTDTAATFAGRLNALYGRVGHILRVKKRRGKVSTVH